MPAHLRAEQMMHRLIVRASENEHIGIFRFEWQKVCSQNSAGFRLIDPSLLHERTYHADDIERTIKTIPDCRQPLLLQRTQGFGRYGITCKKDERTSPFKKMEAAFFGVSRNHIPIPVAIGIARTITKIENGKPGQAPSYCRKNIEAADAGIKHTKHG